MSACRTNEYLCLIARAGWQTLGGLIGGIGGAGIGFGASTACLEACAVAVVPATTLAGATAGIAYAGHQFDNVWESRSEGSSSNSGGMDNKRFLNQKPLQGGRRVSVDAEFGGSGEGRVQVTLQGKGIKGGRMDFTINSAEDIENLPRALRKDQDILNAINKAMEYIKQ